MKKNILENRIQRIIKVSLVVLSTALVLAVLFDLINNRGMLQKKTSAGTNLPVDKKGNVKIFFVGDMMFDRYIRQVSEKRGYSFAFQNVETLLKDNDLIVGNLEGPITDQASVSIASKMGEHDNYIFTFDPAVTNVLLKENIKLVNIGNNHISNFGSSGVESTRKYLTQSGIDYFGDPENENSRMIVENIKGMHIAFVNYNQFVSDSEQRTIVDINKAKRLKADFIILYTHWGVEFSPEPTEKTKKMAHKFIDDGVDLIIGSHPHVIQTKEEYNGKMIYYSLGNFIFDQYFRPETQKGLAVQAEFDASTKKIILKDFQIKIASNGQTS